MYSLCGLWPGKKQWSKSTILLILDKFESKSWNLNDLIIALLGCEQKKEISNWLDNIFWNSKLYNYSLSGLRAKSSTDWRKIWWSGKFWEQFWDFKSKHHRPNMIHKYKFGGWKAKIWNPNTVGKCKIE